MLGHASAAMTMDLYGHLIDRNLWDTGAASGARWPMTDDDDPDEAEAADA